MLYLLVVCLAAAGNDFMYTYSYIHPSVHQPERTAGTLYVYTEDRGGAGHRVWYLDDVHQPKSADERHLGTVPVATSM